MALAGKKAKKRIAEMQMVDEDPFASVPSRPMIWVNTTERAESVGVGSYGGAKQDKGSMVQWRDMAAPSYQYNGAAISRTPSRLFLFYRPQPFIHTPRPFITRLDSVILTSDSYSSRQILGKTHWNEDN